MYLIHWPGLVENGDYESTWSEFERFKQEGLTKYVSWLLSLYPVGFSLNHCFRSIGVSNFTLEDLQRLVKIAHIKPAVNQVSLFITTDHCDLNAVMSGFS